MKLLVKKLVTFHTSAKGVKNMCQDACFFAFCAKLLLFTPKILKSMLKTVGA